MKSCLLRQLVRLWIALGLPVMLVIWLLAWPFQASLGKARDHIEFVQNSFNKRGRAQLWFILRTGRLD